MARVEMGFNCPACHEETKKQFIKPSPLGQRFMHVTCKHCESVYQINIRIKRGRGDSKAAEYDVTLVKRSAKRFQQEIDAREAQKKRALEFKS